MTVLRSLHVVIGLSDKVTAPLKQINKSVDEFRRNIEATTKPIREMQARYLSMSQALAQSKFFFAQMDLAAKEATIRTKYAVKPVQDLAMAFERAKFKVSLYTDTLRTRLENATRFIEQHKAAIAAIGATLSAIGYGGFRVFGGSAKDFERAILEMQARTTLTEEQLKEMTSVVKNLARANSDSFKTISEVVTILTERYGYLGKETRETAQAILDFAKVTGTDAVTAANSISVAMKAFSIPASQMYEVTDTLIAAQQRFGVQAAYIIELLKSNAAPLKMLNLSFSEAVGLLAALEANGVNVSRALMGLRSAAAKGIDVKKALRELAEIRDSTERTRRAVEIFGSYAGPGLARVLEGGTEALDKFMLKIDDVRGTTKKASETIDRSLSEQIGILKNNLTILAVEIGKTLLPVMKGVVKALRFLTDAFEKLPSPVKGVIGVAAGLATIFATVVGPLMVQVAAFTWLYSTIAKMGELTGVLTSLKAAMLGFAGSIWTALAPLLPYIAIATMVAGAILLLQDVLVKGWEKSYLGRFVSWLLEKLPFLKPVAENVAKAINWLRQGVDWLTSTIGSFTTQITQALDTLGPMKYLLLGLAGALLFLAQNFDKVTSAIRNFIAWIRNAWKTLTENPIFNVIKALTPFGAITKAYEIITRKTVETKSINLVETKKKEELLRRNVTEEEIRKRAIEQYEYIKTIKLQGVTNEEEIKRQLEAEFGDIIINPQIIPYVGKPEYDRKFYEEGSIKLKVQEPIFKPVVEKPDLSWLDTLLLHVKPVVEAIKLPSLHALIKPIITNIPEASRFALPQATDLIYVSPTTSAPSIGNIYVNVEFSNVHFRSKEDLKTFVNEFSHEVAEKVYDHIERKFVRKLKLAHLSRG